MLYHALSAQQLAARRWILVAPAVAALLYPALLAGVYHSAHWLSTGRGSETLLSAVALAVSLVLTFAVSAVALAVAAGLGQIERPTAGEARARGFAHLAYASAPLFTFIGVVVYLDGFPTGDYVVWPLLWIAVIAGVWLGAAKTAPAHGRTQAPPWLRPIHGAAAALIIAGFVSLHLVNHLAGFWSAETHIAVMNVLRKWYRSGLVEPLVVALMLFMVVTGGLLLRARLTRPAGWFETLQTATGTYLGVYIVGHMNSVFVYARLHEGIDTDFWFASAGQAGMLGDPWSVRLLPHYALGVWSVITHAGCGLRTVLLSHGVAQHTADRVAAWISVLGAVATVPMILALVRVHIG
jgi:succinate dehydrogenase/fumarate reductase cytochrome b subunit